MDNSEVTLQEISEDIQTIKDDFDSILPSLVECLKRNRYFDEFQTRLNHAEQLTNAWNHLPLLIGIHDVILGMRGDSQVPELYPQQLLDLLFHQGVEEFGEVNKEIDPVEFEVVEVSGEGDKYLVTQVHRPGLKAGHVVLRKAIVSVDKRKDMLK